MTNWRSVGRIIPAAAAGACLFLSGCMQSVAGEQVARDHADQARWDDINISALIAFVEKLDQEGINPEDYSAEALEAARNAQDAAAVEIAATSLFERLANDLGSGTVDADERVKWRIEGPSFDPAHIRETMAAALRERRVAEALQTFAPPHADYRALKEALRVAPAEAAEMNATLRANMERWRRMPRDLGADYVLVNAPSYEAIVVRGGKEIARHRVIVGAKKTPTPQFAAKVTGVTVNPTWFVPESIVAESVGALLKTDPDEAARQGYYVAEDGGVRQKPGPGNALGRMKLAMPNPYSVFLHDTPHKKNFDLERRALSHGCIRVDDATGFAARVLGEPWDKEMIEQLVETETTVTIDLPSPVPVYVVYFTAMTNAAGEIATYPDIYGLDEFLTVGAQNAAQSTAMVGEALGNCPADTLG